MNYPIAGNSRGRWFAAVSVTALAAVQLAGQALPPQLKSAMGSQLKFTPAGIASVEAGRAAAHVVDTGDPEDVFIVGAIRMGVTPAQFVARYRNVTEFESGPGVPAGGKFSAPPSRMTLRASTSSRTKWTTSRTASPATALSKSAIRGCSVSGRA